MKPTLLATVALVLLMTYPAAAGPERPPVCPYLDNCSHPPTTPEAPPEEP